MNNWLLISSLNCGLNELEDQHSWSLSTDERALFLESFYESITKEMPKGKKDINDIMEKASKHTYLDYDPNIEPLSVEEMISFMNHLSPYIRETNKFNLQEAQDYIKEIILS